MKLVYALILLMMFSTSVFSQSQKKVVGKETKKDMPATLINQGNDAYRDEDYSKAANFYKQSLEEIEKYSKDEALDPNGKYKGSSGTTYRVQAYTLLGKAYTKNSKFAEAEDALKKAIDLEKENEDAWFEYGNFFESKNKPNEAINSYFNAIKYAESKLTSANTKDVEDAKKLISKANKNLGDLHESKNPSKALEYYSKAIELNNFNFQAMLAAGKLAENEKRYTDVVNYFSKALDVMDFKKGGKYVVDNGTRLKQMPVCLYYKGLAEYETGKASESIATMKLLLATKSAKDSHIDGANYYMGKSYRKLGDKASATASFKKCKSTFKASAEYDLKDMKEE
jgi:tetratricopeptide (TPR) repeat protein